jgi:hypothetical protein
MCHMLLEVMHESWVENIEQVICQILFKNITKLNFLESKLLSTSLEFEICCVYIFFREWKILFSILFRSPL